MCKTANISLYLVINKNLKPKRTKFAHQYITKTV